MEIISTELYEDEKWFKENQSTYNMVWEYLVEKGFKEKLVGTTYLAELLTMSLRQKYSSSSMSEYYGFIAYRHGIKDVSIQRKIYNSCIKVGVQPKEFIESSWQALRIRQGEKEIWC